jgi:hypothetical protein
MLGVMLSTRNSATRHHEVKASAKVTSAAERDIEAADRIQAAGLNSQLQE